MSANLDCDVLIIGSGAGGATTAVVLAEAGFDVVIVEEGPYVAQGEVQPFSLEQMNRQYRSGGVTVALGLPSIAYTEGRCAGGGTEVNSGLYLRPPVEVVDRWREQFRVRDLDADQLYGLGAEIERDLSVSTVPGGIATPASEKLRLGADRLGWQSNEIPRWMAYPPDGSPAGSLAGSLAGGRRQSMTETYLPRAQRAGARLATDTRVDRLVTRNGAAISADIVSVVNGAEVRQSVRFRHVFVCAGAIQTPALLQRSGIRSRTIGRSLAVHPTVKLAARFDEAINVPDDVPVHQVKEFAPGISFGGSASQPGLVALSLTDQWKTFGPAVRDWPNISVYYAAITSEGRGAVQALPRLRDPLVTYRLTKRDTALLGSGLGRLAHAMLAAGATEVYPSFRGAPIVRNAADLATMQASFAATKASVMTVHLCSTVPFGEHPDRCGADSYGLVKSLSNVRVNDASLLPDAPGVNPQGSIMAIALRNARRFVEEVRPHA
jgi:choline dehydrogenase-like flavoprotein